MKNDLLKRILLDKLYTQLIEASKNNNELKRDIAITVMSWHFRLDKKMANKFLKVMEQYGMLKQVKNSTKLVLLDIKGCNHQQKAKVNKG
jgi:hypothetical protein